MNKKEIEEYIKSKSVTQDNYVAPTVQTHVDNRTPAMVAVAQTVKPTKNKKTNVLSTIGKTLGNIATNMGTGAIKAVEGTADMISNIIANPIERGVNYAVDYLKSGKKVADANYKDLKEMQKRDIKRDLTQEFQDYTGFSDIKKDWEKDSLVKSGNFGGQVAQGIGGMVPSLVMGQAFGSAPNLKSTEGLKGLDKAKTIASNIGETYMSQLPANALLMASSYGSGVEEALNKGATMDQAMRYGLANAAIEQGTEMLTGGVPGLQGRGGIDQFVDPLINKTGGYTNALLKAGYGALGEGIEESASAYLDALANKGILNQDINWNDVNKEALQSGLVGVATGAILNAPENISNFQNVRTESEIRNTIEDRNKQQEKFKKAEKETIENIQKAEQQAIEDEKIKDDSMTSLDKTDIKTVKSLDKSGLKGPFSDLDVEIPGLEKIKTDTKFDNDTSIQDNNLENIAEAKQEPVIKIETTGEKGKQHFQELGANEKVAEILSEVPKKTKPNAKETVKDTIRDVRRAFVSKGETIERLSQETKNPNLNHMYDRLGISRGEAQEHIGNMQRSLDLKPYNNFTDANGNKTTMSLNGIREDAKVHGISEQTLNEYLADYLNVDRYSQGKPVRGVAYTDTMSKENIAKLESQHPQIKRIAQNVWTFEQNQLQNMVDSGLISERFANELKKKNPHYVRIQRDVKGFSNNQKIKNNFNGVEVNRQIDIAKGGNQNILPIMESIAKYTEQVQQSERINLFGQELAKTLSMGSEDTTINSITDEESFGINPELIKENSDGTYTMTIFKNGVATVVPINKGIYESLTPNKSVQAVEQSNLFKKLTYPPKKMSEMFRSLTTQKNPIFMFTNAFRDIGDAPFNSKYTREFLKTYASTEALRQVAGDGVYNQLYEAAGGKQNSYFNNGEFVDKTKSKATKLKEKILMPIEKGNDLVESVPRMAEFIATIKANGYEVNADGELVVKNQNKAKKSANEVLNEALYNAAEVTTNFKRGGDVAKMLNRNGATFFNASIQGFDKQIRNFSALASGDKKQIVNLLLKALVFGIAPTMLNDAMYDDDDEYKELQEYQKDNYYLFKAKDGQWIRIPKGRAMSVIGSAVRRGRNFVEGDKKAFQGFGEFAADQVAPNSFLNNNIFSPFSQVKSNKSWSGNKIISDSMSKRPTEEQYNEKTDEVSKFIGKAIKDLPLPESMRNFKSPLAIHYLIDQYSGAIGDVFLPMITEKSSSKYNSIVAPFVSKFTADSVYSNRSVSDYYDKKTEIETQKNSTKATPIDVAKNSYMTSRNYDISDLYKQQKQIQSDSSLSKSEKYDKAREKQKEINKTAKEIVNDINNIQEEEYYLKIGDYYYKKVMENGEVKYKRDTSTKIPTEKYALYDYFKEKYEKSKE